MRSIAGTTLATALLLAGVAHACALDIVVLPGRTPAVVVTGSFNFRDEVIFNEKVASLQDAVVLFNSLGGNLHAGIGIGTTIRMKGFSTVVLNGSTCASACAFAWLGGANRSMQPDARIGFHSASRVVGDEVKDSSGGNALAGAYLNRIGMSDPAIYYITETPSNSIRWMSFADAAKAGISVRLAPTASSVSRQAAPIAPAPTVQEDPESRMASRLSANFRKRYKAAGMAGINTSIDACYAQARSAKRPEIVTYCVALDTMSAAFDQVMMERLHLRQEARTTFVAVRQRAHDLSASLGIDDDAEMKKGGRVAGLALKMLSAAATSAEASASR